MDLLLDIGVSLPEVPVAPGILAVVEIVAIERNEPPRVLRRLFYVSPAAMAGACWARS